MERVYVGNIDPRLSERDIEDEFREFGVLRSVWVARKPPGFAFIEFDDPRDGRDAIRAKNAAAGALLPVIAAALAMAATVQDVALLPGWCLPPQEEPVPAQEEPDPPQEEPVPAQEERVPPQEKRVPRQEEPLRFARSPPLLHKERVAGAQREQRAQPQPQPSPQAPLALGVASCSSSSSCSLWHLPCSWPAYPVPCFSLWS
eukprot:jgi/Mesen1/10381/ME000081S09770